MSTYCFPRDAFIEAMRGTALHPFSQALADAVSAQGHALKHGHLPRWENAVDRLPSTTPCTLRINNGSIDMALAEPLDSTLIEECLRDLMPWRKGPFAVGDIFIDTEWRSDWKWDRLLPHISPLAGRTVLDVGCGNGYHLWRMRKAGAKTVLGIDPSLLYVKQFDAVQHFIQDTSVQLLPLGMEALPANMALFDTVFSMGVLYHRRQSDEHLQALYQSMAPAAQLILETLVIDGDTDDSLHIDGRYANMRNIYELPTTRRLERWLTQAGFTDIKVADVTYTSRREQRQSAWMSSHSLAQALHPEDASLTVEGHPRPLRAIVIASKRPTPQMLP